MRGPLGVGLREAARLLVQPQKTSSGVSWRTQDLHPSRRCQFGAHKRVTVGAQRCATERHYPPAAGAIGAMMKVIAAPMKSKLAPHKRAVVPQQHRIATQGKRYERRCRRQGNGGDARRAFLKLDKTQV